MELLFQDRKVNCHLCASIKTDANEKDIALRNVGDHIFADEKDRCKVKLETVQVGDCVEVSAQLTAAQDLLLTGAAYRVENVCYDEDGIRERLTDGSIVVHYCISRWCGEGQWRQATPEELGIYASTAYCWDRNYWRLESVSSWSTGTYYPLIFIEDKKKNVCWFFEVEAGTSWTMTVEMFGGHYAKCLNVVFGGADERIGFYKEMRAGDSFEGDKGLLGCVSGDFEDALYALTNAKRKISTVECGSKLVFNDYMNCNWIDRTDKTVLPLIEKAAEAGAEIFCIDDGWEKKQGIWIKEDEKFGEGGLQKIIDAIKSHGMQAGVWFEFETMPPEMAEYLQDDDIFLRRNGKIVADYRPLANFKNEHVKQYLKDRIREVYNMGVRYIKNDHNNAELVGTDLNGLSPAEGIKENHAAFLAFIEELYHEFPGITIENCASGAMRSDNETLKHFSLGSVSDQEDYLLMPSVVSGSIACMPPEKTGIWSYPVPLLNEYRLGTIPEAMMESFKDGEQTIFNMVNGFMGNMYLSGKLNMADAYNFALIKEGVDTYKKHRNFIRNASAVYPCGRLCITEKRTYAFGLRYNNRILLSVYNLKDEPEVLRVDLKKYGECHAELIYPQEKKNFQYNIENDTLTCYFEKGKMARVLMISIA